MEKKNQIREEKIDKIEIKMIKMLGKNREDF
jgi:hypothetical protein